MSKKRKIEFVSPIRRIEQQSDENNIAIDWSKCFICQKNTKEQLLCSFNAKNQEQAHIHNLFNEVAQKINEFKNEHLMPVEMNLNLLSGGGNLGLSLYNNRASIINHVNYCSVLQSYYQQRRGKKSRRMMIEIKETPARNQVNNI